MIFRLFSLTLIGSALWLSGCQAPVTRSSATSPTAAKIVQQARAQIGSPYRYGGESPGSGFDCSGLVYYSLQKTGHRIPRTTGEQYRSTMPVARKNLRPGDLVFFRLRRSRMVSHVGIYLGAGRFVHAPSSHKRVSIASLNAPFWSKHFVRGGRFRL